MAIIVDKAQKRKDIALACKELLLQQGISDVTVSQIAKTAGVGKGTVYDYFENKEDIVFEIVTVMLQEHNRKKEAELQKYTSTKEKVKYFFAFFYREEAGELRTIYKEFISISLVHANQKIIDFQTACFENYYRWFAQILQEGIDKGEIIPEAIHFTKGLFTTAEGMFIASTVTRAISDLQQELDLYIDTLFSLIEVKK